LKNMVLVLGSQFFLRVHQKQSDDVMSLPFANLSLNVNVWELRIWSLGFDWSIFESEGDASTPRITLPHQQRLPLIIHLFLSLLSLVLAPSSVYLDRLSIAVCAEAHAE